MLVTFTYRDKCPAPGIEPGHGHPFLFCTHYGTALELCLTTFHYVISLYKLFLLYSIVLSHSIYPMYVLYMTGRR